MGRILSVPIVITAQPVDFYGVSGDTASFTVEAVGSGLSYQWQVSTNGGNTWGNSTAGGYSTNSMWVNVTDSNGGYRYRCKVTDSSGNVVYSEPGEIKLARETWTFTYDADGMRTQRASSSATYNYVYNGSQLSQMTVDGNTLYFAYDASGTPMSVAYNGTAYYYATNLQGDITAILNTSGTAVVTYTYDAWGNILATSGSMASTLGTHNPLRYRGYVYDTETGLYYLQSRYYNPQVGRFLNADAFAATGQGLLGNNMLAYCNNNPVIYHDSTGNAPISYHNGDRNPLFIGHIGLGGGGCGGIITGGVGTSRKTAKQQANDILQREVNYLSNTDEQVVLDADYIAFYNGVLVVKCDNSLGSFSFGFILLQNTANKAKQKKSLLHEYVHYEHLRDIGIMNYASKVVVPSVTCATLSHLGL